MDYQATPFIATHNQSYNGLKIRREVRTEERGFATQAEARQWLESTAIGGTIEHINTRGERRITETVAPKQQVIPR